MRETTLKEREMLYKKLIKFCVDNNLMWEEMPNPSKSKYPTEINVMIPHWKKKKWWMLQ